MQWFYAMIFGSLLFPLAAIVLAVLLGNSKAKWHFLWYLLPWWVILVMFEIGEVIWAPFLSILFDQATGAQYIAAMTFIYAVGCLFPILFATAYRWWAVVSTMTILVLSYPLVLPVMCTLDRTNCP